MSIGSAAVLGLTSIKTDVYPTTCYLMTFSSKPCRGSCQFCPQGHFTDDRMRDRLSRITWPAFATSEVLSRLKDHIKTPEYLISEKSQTNERDADDKESSLQHKERAEKDRSGQYFSRICLQVVNYPDFFEDTFNIIAEIKKIAPHIPISCAIPPINEQQIRKLKEIGLERICFSLDACTPELFEKIKGKGSGGVYNWETHIEALKTALRVFGTGYVTTHFIVGMGENEFEMIKMIRNIIDMGILPGLFMFTPIRGTPMEKHPRPPITQFRHVQICRYLLLRDKNAIERFVFDNRGILIKIKGLTESELHDIIEKQLAFLTAGCPGCNRPYYNSRPSEEQDGYPRPLKDMEKKKIFDELKDLIDS